MKIRLQLALARAGVASRRRAEALIREGRVAVNGEVVTELGTKADPDTDEITFDGRPIQGREEKATIVLHKPVMVMTTLSDPEGRETVADLVDEPLRFVPVGRLDFHTEGALLLTTDGELMNRLLHPRHHVPKVYLVKVRGRLKPTAIGRLTQGVELEDGGTRPAVVDVLEEAPRHTWIRMVVTEGRNRLIRRMVEAVDHVAMRVVRTEFATIGIGDLEPGTYRYLDAKELARVYETAGLGRSPGVPSVARGRTGVLGTRRRGRGDLPAE